MKKNKTKEFIGAISDFLIKKDISEDELKLLLEEVLIRTFSRDWKSSRNNNFNNDSLIYDVVAELNLPEMNLELFHRFLIVEEVDENNKNQQISINDERIKDKGYKIGEYYIEMIDISNISNTQNQYIKQLLVQKIREKEKSKLYNQYINYKNKIVNAKVHQIFDNHLILDFKGISIFLSKWEMSPLDKFEVDDNILVYISNVKKSAKNSQIIATRKSIEFLKAILEREIEDISDGLVEIVDIAREVGLKTKIVVKTNRLEVDPVGSIIGVKGQRIKNIISILGNEKIDVIKYNSDLELYIKECLLPAKIKGIYWTNKSDDKKEAIVVVDESQYLQTIGKKGINTRLAVRLTGVRLDIKTVDQAVKEDIVWKKIENNYVTNFRRNRDISFNFDDVSLEKISEFADELEKDYNLQDGQV